MPKLGLNQIAKAVDGKIINGKKNLIFSNYHFDSRKIENNGLFFALKTDKSNGHNYINTLKDKKDIGAVVSKDYNTANTDIPLIVVDDPFKSALKLAEFIREKYHKIKFVAITGSAGKTTTKEFLYQILSTKYKVFRSPLNWNNWLGLPFSLLMMRGDEDMAIFEMGMSDPGIGEIDLLANILRPDIAVILNIFPVHLEFLKTIENIAKAKSEILNYLTSDSIAFVSGDFEELTKEVKKKTGRIEFFGKSLGENKIILENIKRDNEITSFPVDFFGIRTIFKTRLISHAHIENLFAAIITAKHLGMKNAEIQNAIWNISPLDRRGKITINGNNTVIDESYNSNPEALKKTLSWIDIEYKINKIAVVGDMLELGKDEKKYHYEVGVFFSRLDFDKLITIGNLSSEIANGAQDYGFAKEKIKSFMNIKDAEEEIRKTLKDKTVVLFKSSRDSGLNKLVENIYGK